MAKERVYTKYAQEAAFLMGQQIKLARKNRKWSSANLAERAGITRLTLQKIEAGDMKASIGLVFEVAVIVGVPLFDEDKQQFSTNIELIQSKIQLLPKRIRSQRKVVDDDF
jgi:transcriptional regulator with XRE-family HTH domain